MGQALNPSVKREADALLASLMMAERHHRWVMVVELLKYIREAGGRLVYLEPCNYALELPTPHKEPK